MTSEKDERSKKQKKNSSKVFEIFAGEYVTLVVKSIKGASKGKIVNLMLAGYLLEECEDYLYIGQSASEVFACVRRDEVAGIMVGDPSEDSIPMTSEDGTEIQ